jgi:NAD(P)-dependent dehydrogenase (short-subunit alcohol dehydrogenase family)
MALDRREFLKLGAAATANALAGCAGTEKLPTPGVPRSPFGANATAEEVTEGLDLSGKLALVTGCTSGIGYETMRVLAKRGAWVLGTSRSLERAEAACASVRGTTSALALELGDFDSVVACADAVRSISQPLDLLVLNAGYFGGSGRPELVDGLEKHFVVNHLGHFVLANRLMGRLYMAEQGRVVSVSSRAAYTRAPESGIAFDNLDAHRDYDDFTFYGHSKLANALFVVHLAELLKGTRITANAVHPGVINTEIDRHMSRLAQAGFAIATTFGFGKSVEQGAATSCYVATSPQLRETSGKFFEDCNAVTIAGQGHVHDAAMAARLWLVS